MLSVNWFPMSNAVVPQFKEKQQILVQAKLVALNRVWRWWKLLLDGDCCYMKVTLAKVWLLQSDDHLPLHLLPSPLNLFFYLYSLLNSSFPLQPYFKCIELFKITLICLFSKLCLGSCTLLGIWWNCKHAWTMCLHIYVLTHTYMNIQF